MMKVFFMLLFMMMMMGFNLSVMFYYNGLFFMSVMLLMLMTLNSDIYMNISLYFLMDNYSFMLIMLSLWVGGLMFMTLNYKGNVFNLMVFMVMVMVLIMFFLSKNLILFYLFFELSLVPTFMMIIYWGYNLERVSSAYYMLMYTLMFSLPLLIYLIKVYMISFSFSMILSEMMSIKISLWGYLIIMGAFLVKLPLYLMHIWLPKAHVEAPVYGSMVLAAILLKLGGYGLFQMSMIFLDVGMKYSGVIFSIGIIGGIVVGLICLVQVDMKSLVAYSSVVHMNMMLCGLLSLYKMGFLGSYIIMISHGLCSSGLFYMVNLFYKRTYSRLMLMNKGMVSLLAMFMIWWFLLCSSNFSFPLSISFLGEIYLIGVILMWDKSMMIYLILMSFFSSAYSLYLFLYVYHGELSYMGKFNSGELKEVLVLALHYIPLLMFLIKMNFF